MNKKSIFITGAGRGIGKATALYFAKKGWFVGLLEIDQQPLQEVANQIGADNCSTHVADVTNVEQLKEAIAAFGKQTGGKMNLLFNNAGILRSGGFEAVPLAVHKAVIDVNVIGVMNATHIALPLLKKASGSAVVNMCSASSLYGNPELTAYAATKSAVKSLTEGWNMLFKKHNIHVCALLPAYVETPMVTNAMDDMKLQKKDVKLGADQIAEAVWQAAHSKKMHHYPGADVKLLRFLKWLLPPSLFEGLLQATFYKEALAKN